jgi:chemotaxis protein methyltransferase CheR
MELSNLSDEELSSLTNAIYKRYGVNFICYEMTSLKRRILKIINDNNLESIHELWKKILYEQDFINKVINEISVELTSMFRDPMVWVEIKKKLYEDYKNKDKIKIWHAGCSTGEEPYTMAILLDEIRLLEKTEILATDTNSQFLRVARSGIFSKSKFVDYNLLAQEYNSLLSLMKYFDFKGEDIIVREDIRKRIKFKEHNLITNEFPHEYDIIFCRNVMIYFDQDVKLRMLNQFHSTLVKNGLLILGFQDTTVNLIEKEKFDFQLSGYRIYKKIL